MEPQKPEELSYLDRLDRSMEIDKNFSKHPMLRTALGSLLDDETNPRKPWLFQDNVFNIDFHRQVYYARWQRLKIYRWLAHKIGPILGVVVFFFAYGIFMAGTVEVIGERYWLVLPLVIGEFFILLFSGLKFMEVVQERWPEIFQESPHCFKSWDELVEIVRRELERQRSRRFTRGIRIMRKLPLCFGLVLMWILILALFGASMPRLWATFVVGIDFPIHILDPVVFGASIGALIGIFTSFVMMRGAWRGTN